jgi:transporter family protein
MGWQTYAILSAIFAGLTALLAKIGVSHVPSNVATLVRTVVVVAFAASIVGARSEFSALGRLTGRDWAALVLSGIATGLSWLFYFAALKAGPISGVAPIDKLSFVIAMTLGVVVLREPLRPLSVVGAALILVGVLLTVPSVQDSLGRAFGFGGGR